MKFRSFTVLVYKEDDAYIAECPEVGTVDQGETIEQAVRHSLRCAVRAKLWRCAVAGLKEATQLYLEEIPLPETSPRFVTSIEVSYA